jgi:hypothetical protein
VAKKKIPEVEQTKDRAGPKTVADLEKYAGHARELAASFTALAATMKALELDEIRVDGMKKADRAYRELFGFADALDYQLRRMRRDRDLEIFRNL